MPIFRVREVQKKYGDLHRVIPRLVNEQGQVNTAKLLGLSPATISKWLKDNGYIRVSQYIRRDDQSAASHGGEQ